MNDLTEFEPRDFAVSEASTEQLKALLSDAIGMTARIIARMAIIWRELEARGEDLSEFRTGLLAYLPRVAAGELDPEVLVRCSGQSLLLGALSRLPLDEQRRVLTDGVDIVEIRPDGAVETVRRHVEDLGSVEVRRAFVGDQVRPAQQQLSMISAPAVRSAQKNTIVKISFSHDEYRRLRAWAAEQNRQLPTLLKEIILSARSEH